MRILLINKFFYLKGGAEKHFFDLKRLLEQNGHQVVVFSTEDGRNESSTYKRFFPASPDFKSLSGLKDYFYNSDAARKLARLIKLTNPDIAHLHNISRYLSPSIIRQLSKFKIPMVQTVHDYQLVCPNYMLYNGKKRICTECFGGKYWNAVKNKCSHDSYLTSALAGSELFINRRLYADRVSKFISPSVAVKKMLVEGGLDENKIEILPHFLFLEEYYDPETPADEMQTSSQAYFLFAGRLIHEKGIQFLVELWNKTPPNARLVIAGEGPLKGYLENFIKNNGLEDRITLAGKLKKHELNYLISNSIAVLVPSLWLEPFSYSVYESMALAKAVIASRLGGIAELIIPDVTGVLVEADNLGEWINAIQRALDFPLEFRAMGYQAGKMMRQFALPGKYYDRLIYIYNQAVKKAK